MGTEKRFLRHPVEVLDSGRPLSPEECAMVERLTSQGLPVDQAERVVRQLRKPERLAIPAGTPVEVLPQPGWRGHPDESPAVLVRSPDGLIGSTRLYNLRTSATPPPRKAKRRPAGHSLWNYRPIRP